MHLYFKNNNIFDRNSFHLSQWHSYILLIHKEENKAGNYNFNYWRRQSKMDSCPTDNLSEEMVTGNSSAAICGEAEKLTLQLFYSELLLQFRGEIWTNCELESRISIAFKLFFSHETRTINYCINEVQKTPTNV